MLGGHGDFWQTSFGGSRLLFGSCGNNTLRWGLSEVLPGLPGDSDRKFISFSIHFDVRFLAIPR